MIIVYLVTGPGGEWLLITSDVAAAKEKADEFGGEYHPFFAMATAMMQSPQTHGPTAETSPRPTTSPQQPGKPHGVGK